VQFLIKKRRKKILLYFFSFVFGHQNYGSGLDPNSLAMLDPDPYPDPDSFTTLENGKKFLKRAKSYLDSPIGLYLALNLSNR
jgi:hypothetical protein